MSKCDNLSSKFDNIAPKELDNFVIDKNLNNSAVGIFTNFYNSVVGTSTNFYNSVVGTSTNLNNSAMGTFKKTSIIVSWEHPQP